MAMEYTYSFKELLLAQWSYKPHHSGAACAAIIRGNFMRLTKYLENWALNEQITCLLNSAKNDLGNAVVLIDTEHVPETLKWQPIVEDLAHDKKDSGIMTNFLSHCLHTSVNWQEDPAGCDKIYRVAAIRLIKTAKDALNNAIDIVKSLEEGTHHTT